MALDAFVAIASISSQSTRLAHLPLSEPNDPQLNRPPFPPPCPETGHELAHSAIRFKRPPRQARLRYPPTRRFKMQAGIKRAKSQKKTPSKPSGKRTAGKVSARQRLLERLRTGIYARDVLGHPSDHLIARSLISMTCLVRENSVAGH